LNGAISDALTNLEKAIELGYEQLDRIQKEDAFSTLRQELRYQAVIKKLQMQLKK